MRKEMSIFIMNYGLSSLNIYDLKDTSIQFFIKNHFISENIFNCVFIVTNITLIWTL